MSREEQAHTVGVVVELADVCPLGEFVGPQGQQNVPVADEVASQPLRRRVVLDQVVALRDGHHELRAEQAARPHHRLHAADELPQWTMVVGTVMPGAARPDGVAEYAQGLGLEEVLLHDLHTVVERLELEAVDESRRVGVLVTRKVDATTVQGERVAFYGDDAVVEAAASGRTNLPSLAPMIAMVAPGAARSSTAARNWGKNVRVCSQRLCVRTVVSSLRVGGEDRATDFVGYEPRGVDVVRREPVVGVGDPVYGVLREDVPAGDRLVPVSEATPTLVLCTDQEVLDGLRQVGGQRDVEVDAEGSVVGETAGEVAFHDDRIAREEIASYLVDRRQ